jgi:HAD superfamily hydrolase (TIGR01490 family)
MTKAARNLALFDLDHTLLPTDSDHEWGRFMVRLGIVDEASFLREHEKFYADYKAGTLDIYAYLRFALAPLARHTREQLHAWHEQFMHEVIHPAMLPAASELVRAHQDAGDLVCMITATNAFVTAPIARAFGIECLIAPIPATIDGEPHSPYSGDIDGIPSFQEGKIIRTEQWLAELSLSWSSFDRSYFYSDSRNDIPLLEKVTDPIATNPDPTLRAHALEHGWRVLELFEAK